MAENRLLAFLKGTTVGIADGQSPTETTTGLTPVPGDPRPQTGAPPYGQSGRANFYGLPQPDEVNPLLIGTRGLETFDTMYRQDAHIRRLILMCWAPIQAATWSLEPHGGDEASGEARLIAAACWWALTEHMSPNLFGHLSTVGPVLLRSGFSPFEQIWESCEYQHRESNKGEQTASKHHLVMPRKLDLRLPRSIWRWWQDEYGELTHVGQILPNKPDVVIPASELVYYRLAPEGDNWVGTSLLRHAYKSWRLKDILERLDAIGQERKAVGVPMIYPPKNAPPEQREKVEALFASMHLSESVYAMMPGPKAGLSDTVEGEGWFVEIIKFDSSAGTGIQESLKYHSDAIASSFLGDFMQLGHHQVGARATAEVQQDPFATAVEAMVEANIKPPLQQLVERMVELNWADAEGAPQLKCQLTDAASLSEISTFVQQLASAEMMVPDPELEDWLRKKADLPPASPDVRKEEEEKRKAMNKQATEMASMTPAEKLQHSQAEQKGRETGEPSKSSEPAKAGGARPKAAKKLDAEPTAKWWEALLAQDRLAEGYAGIREHIDAAVKPYALTVAQQAAAGGTPDLAKLQATLEQHYTDLYRLGHETVQLELNKQRKHLKGLDKPLDTLAGRRAVRAKERAEHSASQVAGAVDAALTKQQISGVSGATLQRVAETAAERAVHAEATETAPAMIADGRYDAAETSQDIVGGYYTAIMDLSTCDECEAADNNTLLSVEDAEGMVPNPDCQGGPRCRCQIIWVLSEDPAALGVFPGAG